MKLKTKNTEKSKMSKKKTKRAKSSVIELFEAPGDFGAYGNSFMRVV
jgi:hypothetical protein